MYTYRSMSFRSWLTIITFVLIALLVYFAWPELVKAWSLIETVNLWILALVIPVQLFSYFATGGMIFSYLRSKGNLQEANRWQLTRISLELNFVNHILPSGGAAGFSYLGWILSRFGVTPGRATMSQIVRFTLTFLSFVLLLVVAVIYLSVDHSINRTILLLCGVLTTAAIGGTAFIIYIVSNQQNQQRFSAGLTTLVNKVVRTVTRGRRKRILKPKLIENFFSELRQDYLEIRRDIRVLVVPFIWAILANLADVALIFIAFWALGEPVNPAALFIAFGLSAIAGALTVTPGGAGVYEAIMIAFLASAGVPADVAIAGTLLARVTLILGTVLFGYFFYQLTLNKYGKRPTQRQ